VHLLRVQEIRTIGQTTDQIEEIFAKVAAGAEIIIATTTKSMAANLITGTLKQIHGVEIIMAVEILVRFFQKTFKFQYQINVLCFYHQVGTTSGIKISMVAVTRVLIILAIPINNGCNIISNP
jgi:hypothetical protein